MCGVNGALVFERSNFELSISYIEKMRDTMIHRGPDGADLWIASNKKVGFGHRRLSIIDLSDAAKQPMVNDDGTVVLTFNGEIYNHAEIKKEIQSIKQFKWRTDHSDTEVLLRAYEVWGRACVHKFRGMFAFAIWDARSQELWLVRDRIGVKPLYYSVVNDRFIFASEIKALLTDPALKPEVDEESFFHYLSFLTTPAPNTLFRGVKKLRGGHELVVQRNGQIQENRYWDVLDHTTPLVGKSDEEIADLILNELRTSVALRKVSDVPVGVFLSGGIDSSTNAALFSEGDTQRVKTFSIGYEGEYKSYQNELHFARQMAERVNAEHHEMKLNVDHLIDFLPKMIHLQDEPIADPVCVPVYYVSKLARDNGVIVCQVGEGADELFWGYESWKVKLKLQEYNDLPVPRLLKKMGLSLLEAAGKKDRLYYELLRRGTAGQPVFWGGAEAFTDIEKQSLLSPRLKKQFKGYSSWEALKPIYQDFQERAWEKSNLNWMSYLDLKMRLPELLLMRVDKMSMGVSLEGRVPFLDYKFVELAMSIPSEVKTRHGVSKYILKKAVTGVIPDNLIHRKKQGFGVPVYEWFFDRLGDTTKKELYEFCDSTDFLDRAYVDHLLATKRGPDIWYLLNFALWWKHYVSGK
ncbi:MAG: asparagine synthase (glutamine-hydrolyzing) [Deltaproteobacteria bacterium]|nr:asparagine synthase (glutamine-hydrolyzing) [Deltaproteobacteria bacterium]